MFNWCSITKFVSVIPALNFRLFSIYRCAEGYYSDSLGSVECILCPAGSMCPETHNSPMLCSLGTYSLMGQTRCTPCPVGHNCSVTDESPVSCPDGWYSADGVAICTPCPLGYYCPITPPSPTPIQCPTGHYSDVLASTDCVICPVGHECSNQTQIPQPCPAGQFAANQASTVCTEVFDE